VNRQFHPDLSPLGWHIGHCALTERYWLREVVLGETPDDDDLQALYFPENSRKDQRAAALPARDELLAWARALHDDNRALLAELPSRAGDHALVRDGYLVDFLAQHYAQHLETMAYVLAQRALTQANDLIVGEEPQLQRPAPRPVRIAGGEYTIGCDALHAYDNERPGHRVTLEPATLARDPVSNAQFLAFIEDDGYRRRELWSDAGWRWREQEAVDLPVFWRRDHAGRRHELTPDGPRALVGDAPVSGLGYWEAEAFARWAGARLPHEHEWEVLAGSGALGGIGQVWEWCANPLAPYPGFRPFPYDGYSMPWFDGNHFVLRGGSVHTRGAVRRTTFRNFYEPDKRHLFAGLRLAW
jgi:iron(II)-dependent oxidoreductase